MQLVRLSDNQVVGNNVIARSGLANGTFNETLSRAIPLSDPPGTLYVVVIQLWAPTSDSQGNPTTDFMFLDGIQGSQLVEIPGGAPQPKFQNGDVVFHPSMSFIGVPSSCGVVIDNTFQTREDGTFRIRIRRISDGAIFVLGESFVTFC